MTLDDYLLFLPACFAINMAFGPNNLLSLSNGARDGTFRAVAAASGRLVAFAIMIAVAGLGLGTLLTASEVAFAAVKWIGAAYLVWLGIKLLRADAPVLDRDAAGRPQPLQALIRQEFWVAAGNPKAILVFTAFFPQFVVPSDYAASFALLGASFLVLEVVAITAYALIGARLGRVFRTARPFRWLNRISGSLMIGFGLLLAAARRPAG
ncbi:MULTISPECIES: LysE family translocator [Inquilinus]|uniref:Threonine/homoserine/homoserine lactone efflux protein n=1 Tax=Inquilinus ginsengisoli TaxID=363840 RepID=A0ABU1JGE0_9PROT|nr:LysE family transporter [Inquilinus ginsengisoli]MDR6287687.1 threonine/homoserine/homoserine lactone efflux protein [Inquilinus ginsengisoli]